MNRTLLNRVAGAVLSILVAGSAAAGDHSQLAGSARIGAADAAGMTLDEIAARKFSREGRDNVQIFAQRGIAADAVRSSRSGRTESLDAFHLRLVNESVSGEQRQIAPEREAFGKDPAARAQLVASAGLGAEAASGMSLDAIAGQKFNREADGENKAPVRQ